MYNYKHIRDIREDRDLKQSNIANILEITREQYVLYETGKREIKVHHIIKLCKFYNVTADYLLGLTDTPAPLPEKEEK